MDIVDEVKETKSGVYARTESSDTGKREEPFLIVADIRSLFNLRAEKSGRYEIRITCGKFSTSSGVLVGFSF